jgi:7,8-dihydropterin-6-yl-methyl-4-(beta-D-ribofuranosyl)aminobenzene 5'-phosphate synthase
MIKEGKKENHLDAQEIIMDLHPARPDYRGFMIAEQPVSMEADPTFEELQSAGARIQKSSIAHTVLDDMFLISGEIPRVTPYETGLRNSIRFDKSTNLWSKDESMTDERFLMCNLKGLI